MTLPIAAAEAPKANESQQMLDMYIELARPVDDHKRLSLLEGTWKITQKMWFDPSQPAMESRGTATGKWILGGRFLTIEAKTGDPVPTESLTLLGFDRRTNDYTLVAYDTLGTYYVTAAGKHDPTSGELSLGGSYQQPPTGKEQKYRFVITKGAKGPVMAIYFDMPGGKEMKVSEMFFER